MPFRRLLLAFLTCLTTLWAADLRGGERSGDAPTADGRRIDGLIRQLSSDDFEEREAATQALARVGGPVLDALRKAASTNPDPEARRRADELVVRIENGLDQLLADYRSFGLPLPPETAPLARVEDPPYRAYESDNGRGRNKTPPAPPTHWLGFVVPPTWTDRPVRVLSGTRVWEREVKQVGAPLDPQRLTSEFLEANLPREWLGLALQMHARGWKAAETLFEIGSRQEQAVRPRTELRYLAWEYWEARLRDKSADYWPAASRQMKALVADEPELDTPANRRLLHSLEAALVPSRAAPGSVESIIDDLVNARWNHESDDRFARVLDLGFEAVPALLKHLDDDRLTRCIDVSIRCHCVGDLASDLLRSLAGRAATEDWPDRPEDSDEEKRCAREWWDAARQQGEEAYLLAHVLPPPPPHGVSHGLPESAQVHLLGKKYPRSLLRLYRDVLQKRPDIDSEPLAAALAAMRPVP